MLKKEQKKNTHTQSRTTCQKRMLECLDNVVVKVIDGMVVELVLLKWLLIENIHQQNDEMVVDMVVDDIYQLSC